MLKIRLARRGKKRQPFYRIVVADVEAKRDGRYVEQIGYYDPMKDPIVYMIKEDRALHWLSVGAQPTDAAKRLLDKQGTYERLERVRAGEEIDALFAEFEGRPWPPVPETETVATETEETPEPVVEVEEPVAEVVETPAEPVVAPAAEVVAPDPEPEPAVEEPVAEVVEEAPEPVAEPEPEPAPVVKKKATKYKPAEGEDDLTKIEGIGPKIAATLQAAGIRTYFDLAGSSATQLKEIVSNAGISATPNTWPTQATFAATGDWDELKNLQGKLKGGR